MLTRAANATILILSPATFEIATFGEILRKENLQFGNVSRTQERKSNNSYFLVKVN